MNMHSTLVRSAAVAGVLGLSAAASAQAPVSAVGPPSGTTPEAPMLRGDTASTSNGWTVTPLFTVGEKIKGYQPVGLLDGIAAFPANQPGVAKVLVNHELGAGNGYAYTLDNGTLLTGARITAFTVKRTVSPLGEVQTSLRSVGLAYGKVMDRRGVEVTDPAQINESGVGGNGFDRFCSSQGVAAGTYGFVDDVYFTGEESGKPFHAHGGTVWALDVKGGTLWGAPALGRGAWENVTAIDTGDPSTVGLILADDTESAPLYLYVGTKDSVGDGSFLDRNGLKVGKLYAWKADAGDLSPEQFHGFEESRSGAWVELVVQDPLSAGLPGYDADGYLDNDTLTSEADSLGCFSFSRPEDVSTNPLDGTQVVFASTGRGSVFPSDNWGTIYVVDVDVAGLTADFLILHDADDLPVPDEGIRNPDNLDWARDGKVYVQEDRSTSPASLFGGATGIEASVWMLDPVTRAFSRIAEVDRSAVAPAGATDPVPGDIGNWETSGILDVTHLFETLPGERLLVADVQAHSVKDGPIGGSALLGEGGQLVFLSKVDQ